MIRTKGRNKFDHHGRSFVWYVKDDCLLCIASSDKRFSVWYELIGNQPLMSVSGQEFIGIARSVKRPAWIVPPNFGSAVGGKLIQKVLDWCFDENHEIVPYEGPSGTTVERAWDSGLTSD